MPSLNLSHLNPAQTECVYESTPYVQILAGAGSGKTTVLTLRVARQIIEGQNPDSIFCISFTVKAAEEMRSRLNTLLGGKFPSPWMGTFHSLAFHLLRCDFEGIPNWFRMGWQSEPQVWDSIEDHLQALQLASQKDGHWDLSIEEIDAVLHSPRSPLDAEDTQHFHNFAHHFNLSIGRITFDSMLNAAVELLQKEEQIRLYWQQKVAHLLVDEYQDIDPLQYQFCRLLLGTQSHFLTVGDDDQAIYGFRGADPRCMLDFQKDFPQAKRIKLEENYRSHPKILALANRIFEDKDPALRKILRGQDRKTLFQPVQVRHFPHSQAECQWLAKALQKIHSKRQSWNGIALLCRYNRLREYYEQAMHYYGIPLKSEGIDGIQIMTLHASKGLEFDFVFYLGASEGLSPGKDENPAEERRLFYVGVTRAIQGLVLLHSNQRIYKDKIQSFRPSPYLQLLRQPWWQKAYRKLWLSDDLLT